MENLTGGTPPVRYLPCVVPCKLYFATGEKSRWERYDVLGEIKPECMPDWAKEALAKIKEQQKEKKQKNREER